MSCPTRTPETSMTVTGTTGNTPTSSLRPAGHRAAECTGHSPTAPVGSPVLADGGWRISSAVSSALAPPRARSWRPPPAEYHAEISLEEAFQGTTRTLRTQDGRSLEVKIPAGVDNGSRVHLAPDGPQGSDYYLVVSVADHPQFKREGRDLYVDVDLQVDDAVLGAEIRAPTLTGQVALTVPPNTPNERRFRLSGQGIPSLSGGEGRGDLYVTAKLRLPANPSEDEVELFRRLRELRNDTTAANGAHQS